MTALTVVCVLTGLVNAIPVTLASTVLCPSALNVAPETVTAQAVCATVVLVGLVMLVRFPLAPLIATIMVSVLMASAIAVLVSLVRTVLFVHALLSATTMVSVLTTLAIAMRVSLDLTALSSLARLSALVTGIVTMVLASVSLVSLVCSVLFLPALRLAPVMDSALPLVLNSSVSVMRVTRDMIVLRSLALMTAPTTESALMVCALVRMAGEVMTAPAGALVRVKGAVVTESVLKESATVTPDGLVTLVISALACMTVLNTVTVPMVLACAKRDTAAVTAPFLLNPNLANAPFTVCVDAFNNALRCTRHKVLVLLMSVIPSVPRSVFPNVLLVSSQLLCPVTQLFLLTRLMLSPKPMRALRVSLKF